MLTDVKVRADGSLGARTLAALAEADIERVITSLCEERLRFLKRLKAWKHFRQRMEEACRLRREERPSHDRR